MNEIDVNQIATRPADVLTATRVAGREPVRDNPKLAQAAKDFESVLLGKMMEEMHNTVQDSGLLEDSGSSQMQGIFWSFLAKDVADKGGLGLWKDLYDQWARVPGAAPAASADADQAKTAGEVLP